MGTEIEVTISHCFSLAQLATYSFANIRLLIYFVCCSQTMSIFPSFESSAAAFPLSPLSHSIAAETRNIKAMLKGHKHIVSGVNRVADSPNNVHFQFPWLICKRRPNRVWIYVPFSSLVVKMERKELWCLRRWRTVALCSCFQQFLLVKFCHCRNFYFSLLAQIESNKKAA